MLCQKCGLNPATVHRESLIFRQKVQEHLCAFCAGTGVVPMSDGTSMFLGGFTEVSRLQSTTYRIVKIDAEGNPIGQPEIIDQSQMPTSKLVPHGLKEIPAAVKRFFESKAARAGLCLGVQNKEYGALLTLLRRKHSELDLMFEQHSQPESLESAVRAFFAARGFAVPQEIGKKGQASRVFHLIYPLSDAESAAVLIVDLLRTCYGVAESDALRFTGD